MENKMAKRVSLEYITSVCTDNETASAVASVVSDEVWLREIVDFCNANIRPMKKYRTALVMAKVPHRQEAVVKARSYYDLVELMFNCFIEDETLFKAANKAIELIQNLSRDANIVFTDSEEAPF